MYIYKVHTGSWNWFGVGRGRVGGYSYSNKTYTTYNGSFFLGRMLSASESVDLVAMAAVMYIKDKLVSRSFKNQSRYCKCTFFEKCNCQSVRKGKRYVHYVRFYEILISFVIHASNNEHIKHEKMLFGQQFHLKIHLS